MLSHNVYSPLAQGYATFANAHNTIGPRSDERGDLGPDNQLRAIAKVRGVIANNTGLLLITVSQFFFALVHAAVKKMNSSETPVPVLELVFVRMSITYIFSISCVLLSGVPDPFFGPKEVRLLLAFRGFCGFFALVGIYCSLQYLSLPDATVLTFLAPLCTGVAGALSLGEIFTRRQALAGVFSLAGVVLIARPATIFGHHSNLWGAGAGSLREPNKNVTSAERLFAVCMAMVGVSGATGAFVLIRAIGKRAHPLHHLICYSTLCVAVSSVAMLATKTQFVIPTGQGWLLALFGIFGFLAQVFLTMGLQRETAGRGTMAVYTQIVFATVLDQIFFHSVPSTLSVIGTLIILTSTLYVAFTKERGKTANITCDQPIHESFEEGFLGRTQENQANYAGNDQDWRQEGRT